MTPLLDWHLARFRCRNLLRPVESDGGSTGPLNLPRGIAVESTMPADLN
jgi:hypothetical protein